ncbi:MULTISPECIES: ribonuclease P protein component [unclassified Thioalkalivibrio]|uniref:ribonuclease P protein component n=1 Tax=unclassified Thioalkalivibrio TaxID=2621013 RepID=UPI0003758BF3|nr:MULTISPECIES: ribonuclease P protein component [unclassified Thioalkalivibrio]
MTARAQGFPRQARLLVGADFQHVFADARPVRGRYLTLLSRAREGAEEPRLGLAIGKRHVRNATDRNRIKRIAREAFRQRRAVLPPVDLIVLARPGAGACDRRALRLEMETLLDRLQ